MATIRKKNGKWHVQVRRKGYPSLNHSFLYKEGALRWAKETERELDQGLIPISISDLKGYCLRDLLIRYIDQITPTKRGADTERFQLRRILRHSISSLSLDQLNTQAFATYRDQQLKLVCGSTIRREMSIISHCLDIAHREWGIPIPNNPLKNLRLPSPNPSRTRRLAPGELDRLVEAAQGRVWYLVPIIRFAIATGMRRGEILSLTWADIDLDKRLARLKMTKNGQPREVPLGPEALLVLREVPRDNSFVFPFSPNALRLSWERLCKSAGIEDLHFHDLRHKAISGFFEMGLTHPVYQSDF